MMHHNYQVVVAAYHNRIKLDAISDKPLGIVK